MSVLSARHARLLRAYAQGAKQEDLARAEGCRSQRVNEIVVTAQERLYGAWLRGVLADPQDRALLAWVLSDPASVLAKRQAKRGRQGGAP